MSSSVPLRVISFAAVVLAAVQVVQCQCKDYKSAETTTCSMLFQRFQSALVGSQLNLYNLRKTFSPASHPAPILVNVSYEISFGHVRSDLCPGVDNDSSLFNTSVTRYLNYGWTSSAFYTFFHPAELNRLQPQLVFLFLTFLETWQEDKEDEDYPAYAFTWDGTGPITTAKLSLNVPSLPCTPSYEGVYDTLWDMTSLLKIYTEIRTNLTTWKSDDAEYVIDGNLFLTGWSLDKYIGGITVLLVLSMISVVFAIVFLIIIVKVVFKMAPQSPDTKKFKVIHSLLWVSVSVLAQFVFVLLFVDFIQIVRWCSSPSGCSAAAVFKSIPFLSFIVTVVVLCCCSARWIPNNNLFRAKPWSVLIFFPLNVVSPYYFFFCHLKEFKVFKTLSKYCSSFLLKLLLPTLFASLLIVLFYMLPVILLLVVHPIKVTAAYSFLIAALVLYILIAFYGEYKIEASYEGGHSTLNRCSLFFYLFVPQLNTQFICAIMYLFIAVYIAILSGGPQISVFHAILSQIPALILSSAIWLFKKWFLKKEKIVLTDPDVSESSFNELTTSTSSREKCWSQDNTREGRGRPLQRLLNYGAVAETEDM